MPLDSAPPVVLELRGMTKQFGEVVACDDVDLNLRRGEIHGILGVNGAGKSTLMRMVIGLATPDLGTVRIDGETVRVTNPHEAASRGIGMVHQHFSLVDALTVWENVALGEQGALEVESTRDKVASICHHYGLEVDPDARVGRPESGSGSRSSSAFVASRAS